MTTIPDPPPWDDREEGDVSYGMVMPFIKTESHGGPYQDLSFVAGFQMGTIYGFLSDRKIVTTTFLVYSDLVDQLDLIAMRYNYTTDILYDDGTWAQVGFTRVDN